MRGGGGRGGASPGGDGGGRRAGPSPGRAGPLVGKRVRVWWAPTRQKQRTAFAGAYWPAMVVEQERAGASHVVLRYDNGDESRERAELVSATPPGGFGEEKVPLVATEMCEVSNRSRTDPAEWLARVKEVHGGGASYTIEFPFHDAPPERVQAKHVRRARVPDGRRWLCLDLGQKWRDGSKKGPQDLATATEEDLLAKVLAKGAPKKAKAPPKEKPPASAKGSAGGGKTKEKGTKRKAREPSPVAVAAGGGRGAAVPAEAAAPRAWGGLPHPGLLQDPLQAWQMHMQWQMMQMAGAVAPPPPPAPGHPSQEAPAPPPKKQKRDPAKPKRPLNAYLVFLGRHREEMRKANPGSDVRELTALLAKSWQKVSAKEKALCEAAAQKDRARYEREMKAYTKLQTKPLPDKVSGAAQGGAASGGAGGGAAAGGDPAPKRGGKKKQAGAPKAPKSAWTLFLAEQYAMPYAQKLKFGDASKLIATAWKNLPKERKARFEKLADAEKAAYQKKLQAFLKKKAREEAEALGPAPPFERPALPPAPGAEVPNYGIPVHNGMVPIQVQLGTLPVWIPMPPPGLSLPQHVNNLRGELEKVPLIPMGIPGLAPGGRPPTDPGRLPQGVPVEAPAPVQPTVDLGPHMHKIKKLLKRSAQEEAYYMLIDLLRPGSEHRALVAKAAMEHIILPSRADLKAFLVAVFGLEKGMGLMKSKKAK